MMMIVKLFFFRYNSFDDAMLKVIILISKFFVFPTFILKRLRPDIYTV